jgi:hypothetical protein
MTLRPKMLLLTIVLFSLVATLHALDAPRVCVKHVVSPLRYPPLARAARLQGTITAKLLIGVDGAVRSVTTSTDDLSLRSHPVLQDEIERLVRQWTFECFGCASAEFEHSVRFTYRLNGEDSYEHDLKVTMDLPGEVAISDTPPVCDHCPAKDKR